MKNLTEFINEAKSVNPDDIKKFLLKNKEYILDGLNKYYGGYGTVVTGFNFKYIFSGVDKNGKPVKGIYLTYKDNEGKFNQDAYISFDGYIVSVSGRNTPKRIFNINTYHRILPDLSDKLKIK